MTGLVDRAERRGLVRRAASPHDGRAVQVSLSAQGQEPARVGAADADRWILACVGAADADRRILALTAGLPDERRRRPSLLAGTVVSRFATI